MGTTTEELLKQAQQYLDQFEESHNLRAPYLPTECEKILSLNYDDLTKLTIDDCGNYAFILEQYAYYLQRVVNEENATLQWLNGMLDKLVCDKLNNYDQYTRHDIKVRLIARENQIVDGILKNINLTKQKIARLEFISPSIKAISKSLNDIRQTKLAQFRSNNG